MKPYLIILFLGFVLSPNVFAEELPRAEKKLTLSSPAFVDGAVAPNRYTCSGANINPPLVIENIPPKTKSLTLIVDDPTAQEGVWVHWLVYNIPAGTTFIAEKSNPGIQGLNDFGRFRYQGPCPTDEKPHKYSFRIYALDTELDLLEGIIKSDVEGAMRGHILEQAELTATLRKKSSVIADND